MAAAASRARARMDRRRAAACEPVLPLHVVLLLVGACVGGAVGAVCNTYSSKQYCQPAPSVPLSSRHLHPELSGTAMDLAPCGKHARDSGRILARFAVLGDIGLSVANCEGRVSSLVDKVEGQFGPLDFVVATGDQNYWDGSCRDFEQNVAQYYGRFFTGGPCTDPTPSNYGQLRNMNRAERTQFAESFGAPSKARRYLRDEEGVPGGSRFWPTLGNHDWDTWRNYSDQIPHLQYFDFLARLPGSDQVGAGGQYYTVSPTPDVQLFALNSNLGQPGCTADEQRLHDEQALWLKEQLARSTAAHRIVFFHHPPYTTARHDPPATWMVLPFGEWGATMVLNGHQHAYERIERDTVYVINGLGGHPWLYEINSCAPLAGSQVRYNEAHGVVVGLLSRPANGTQPELDVCFYSVTNGGMLVDHFRVGERPESEGGGRHAGGPGMGARSSVYSPLSVRDMMDPVLAGAAGLLD